MQVTYAEVPKVVPSSAIEKAKQTQKTKTRIFDNRIIEVPGRREYLPNWKELGITLLENSTEDLFLIKAYLPEDWKPVMTGGMPFEYIYISLIDNENLPRVVMHMEKSRISKATFLSKEEAKLQVQNEQQEEEVKMFKMSLQLSEDFFSKTL